MTRTFTIDAVVIGTNLGRVARGRAAVVESYADFARSARMLEMTTGEPQIDFCAGIAIVTLPWSMRYEIGGIRKSQRGFDTYVFCIQDGRWRICWRSMVSAEED